MEIANNPTVITAQKAIYRNPHEIATLVAAVYPRISPPEQSQLLGHLLKPLGILSLVAVANGIFAKLWFQSGQQILQIRPDDAHNIQASDVIELVSLVQQVSVETVDGIATLLTSSPALAGSATAALLVTVLMQRIQRRKAKVSGQPLYSE
jgi:hypothetical protein